MFTVGLSTADREFLVKLTTTGVHSARMIMRARVLVESDRNAGPVPDRAVIAQRVGTSTNTVRDREAVRRDRRGRAGQGRDPFRGKLGDGSTWPLSCTFPLPRSR
jgi:hypothetical protein